MYTPGSGHYDIQMSTAVGSHNYLKRDIDWIDWIFNLFAGGGGSLAPFLGLNTEMFLHYGCHLRLYYSIPIKSCQGLINFKMYLF